MAQSRLHPLRPHPLTIVPGGLSIEEEGAAGQGRLPPDYPISTVATLPPSLAALQVTPC